MVALLRECRANAVCHSDRVLTTALVEHVREERVELDAEHAPLREQRAVLFDDGEEMRHGIWLREHDGFTEECPTLRAVDVEHVRQAGNGGERQLACGAAECIGKPRSVEEERDLVCTADRADRLELIHRIECAVLRRMREVDHAGAYHVVAVRVRAVGAQAALNSVCRELAVRMWECEYLVTAGFDCACLMHRDMPCIGGITPS